jgi:hypothetical protein
MSSASYCLSDGTAAGIPFKVDQSPQDRPTRPRHKLRAPPERTDRRRWSSAGQRRVAPTRSSPRSPCTLRLATRRCQSLRRLCHGWPCREIRQLSPNSMPKNGVHARRDRGASPGHGRGAAQKHTPVVILSGPYAGRVSHCCMARAAGSWELISAIAKSPGEAACVKFLGQHWYGDGNAVDRSPRRIALGVDRIV